MISNEQYENQIQEMKDNNVLHEVKSSIEQKELKQNGYSIFYYSTGDKENELIVFLHPAFADHRCFDKQIDYFAKEFRVVTIDMLGHGLSKVGKAKDKIDFTIHHIDTILKNEGYSKAHFVGVSMGTLIAQYYSLHNPDKVQSMTILGGYDINADNKEISKAQRSENIKWVFKALFSMNSFRRYVSSVSVSNPVEQARFYEMASLFTRKSFTCMSGLGNILKQRDNIARNYPLLILSGDKDIELAKKMSKRWHDSEPTSKFHMIENAGHCANMDNADEFNSIVMNFIKKDE
ncbi:MAG: alpha/beta hydrolase [Candidatus Marinimicrobia bacterium]|nr:alpha/beta hydrolase [Candidatus Neomarinimicrobiota bacterium]